MPEVTEENTPLEADPGSQVSSPNKSFNQQKLEQYFYKTPDPKISASPSKRKSPLPDIPSPFSNKRVTRSASSASLNAAAVGNQQIFPPPVDLSPSPAAIKSRAVSTPSPLERPLKKRKKSEDSTAGPASPVNHLRDALAPNLHIMFVGVNPGLQTAATGYAYAHPSNKFYPLLYRGGITPQKCHASEYRSLVERYGLGHTNIVQRPTRDASSLSKKEMEDGVANIEAKARLWKPGCVVLVGKGVWEAVERVWRREGKWNSKKPFKYGWLDAWIGKDKDWPGARIFAATTTSGLAVTPPWQEKIEIWKELGSWYQQRVAEQKQAEEEVSEQ